MRIALYNENAAESRDLARQLRVCGRDALRQVEVTAFESHMDFCRAARDGPEDFDLLVVAQDGTFSLEIMDYLQACHAADRALWFSDLDFGVRSYTYRVIWFGRKPVTLSVMRKAFDRAMEIRAHRIRAGRPATEHPSAEKEF